MSRTRSRSIKARAPALAISLAACIPNQGKNTAQVAVEIGREVCSVSQDWAEAGSVDFRISNTSDELAVFYVLSADGDRVIAELEDVAPGGNGGLKVELGTGDYQTGCKVGERGKLSGLADFKVRDE